VSAGPPGGKFWRPFSLLDHQKEESVNEDANRATELGVDQPDGIQVLVDARCLY
jgi:hypothetical protein